MLPASVVFFDPNDPGVLHQVERNVACRIRLPAVVLSGITLLFALPLLYGEPMAGQRQCGVIVQPGSHLAPAGPGGKHIPAQGVFRVLLVFASFPDDETPHPFWPAHQPPVSMEDFIDADTTIRSQSPFNLTHYFHRMSLGQFHLVGDVLWVETRHSQEEYRNGAFGRANTDVLKECVDSLVDFSQYDAWKRNADYVQTKMPDSLVDMIIMVWRTSMFEYIGEASLGHKPGFLLDGKRIEMGFPELIQFPLGSGVTCEYLYTDAPTKLMRTMAHEVGHWLLGGPHPYNGLKPDGKHSYWGILCSGDRISSCANSYERERLGWIAVPDLPADATVSLPDYLETGVAYKYHPPDGEPDEFYYFENHQLQSPFDDVTVNPLDKGLWILHQQGPYMEMDNLRIRPSDGDWKWENPGTTTLCFSRELPVFRRNEPGIVTGQSHRDQIPTRTSAVEWMYVFDDGITGPVCGAYFAGYMFRGAYSTASTIVFSPYSNPPSNTWAGLKTTLAVEITGQTENEIVLRRYGDPLDTSPARRYLGVHPTARDSTKPHLPLAWGNHWSESPPPEADVQWSELERMTGVTQAWTPVYQGPASSWTDTSFIYDTAGTVPVFFRVRVRDNQGKYSAWSNVFHAVAITVTGVHTPGVTGNADPVQFGLSGIFPNPCNPTATIEYFLPDRSDIRLTIFDLLGRKVRDLMDGPSPGGVHTATWDGTTDGGVGVPSGVYLCHLQAGARFSVRKILLLR